MLMKKMAIIMALCTTTVTLADDQVPYELLKKLLPKKPIILEAGAQFGEDTTWMSNFWPEGTIYAFEPNPDAYTQLQTVAQKKSNIIIEKLALSNTAGTFPFYIAGGASSLLRPTDSFNKDYFHADLQHPIYVQTITLDAWAEKKGVNTIDFLWLDMEGNELRALRGATKILPTVSYIYTEVNLQKFWHDCVQYQELKSWLESNGFEEIWKDITPHWHGNVLFKKKNLSVTS
ncbi:FkbM family methyltransferase [Candidatus Dependentiae bacterium]|nr:FkbM family methyltransferase [Candidatus Dependentiae bacterium]